MFKHDFFLFFKNYGVSMFVYLHITYINKAVLQYLLYMSVQNVYSYKKSNMYLPYLTNKTQGGNFKYMFPISFYVILETYEIVLYFISINMKKVHFYHSYNTIVCCCIFPFFLIHLYSVMLHGIHFCRFYFYFYQSFEMC